MSFQPSKEKWWLANWLAVATLASKKILSVELLEHIQTHIHMYMVYIKENKRMQKNLLILINSRGVNWLRNNVTSANNLRTQMLLEKFFWRCFCLLNRKWQISVNYSEFSDILPKTANFPPHCVGIDYLLYTVEFRIHMYFL